MSKGLALLEQSLLQYDEERLRARLPLDPRAMLQKRDVNTLSMSPRGDCSPEMVKKDDGQFSMELPFNTVIVKNKCDANEGRDGDGERRGGEDDDGEESDEEEDDEEESEEEDDEESEEEDEPGCSSETKGLVFSSFDSDSEDWEPPAKRMTEEDRGAADGRDTKQKSVQPFVIKRDIGSFVFHNCSLKENRNSRSNEPHRERNREKEKPSCSAETTAPKNNTTNAQPAPTTNPQPAPQNNTTSSFIPAPTTLPSNNAGASSDAQKLASKRKKTKPNPDGEVVKTTKHKCADCGKYFQCEAHLQRHMLIHYGLKPFECPVCDKAFRYKSSYKAHLNMHTEEKPLSCSICDKGFTQSRDLKRHMLSHTDEKNFDCPECGGKFKHKHNLIRHISVIHKAEKRYPCPMCDKAFAQKHDFMTHMRTHSGEKPFTCHVCTRSFGAKGTLRTHMKVHKKTGSKDLPEELTFETGDESMSDL